jgi:hypothetical protein
MKNVTHVKGKRFCVHIPYSQSTIYIKFLIIEKLIIIIYSSIYIYKYIHMGFWEGVEGREAKERV